MKRLLACALGILMLASLTAAADVNIRQEQVRFEHGNSATIRGRIKGDQNVDYRVHAGAGQRMSINFKPSNLSAYFNVLPPGSDEAIFVGSTWGNRFEGKLPAAGEYTIRVYLMRNAARRDESARYTLKVAVAGTAEATPSLASTAFDRTLELQGIKFRVSCANEGSVNTLRIEPAGLELDNSPIERTINGTISGADVADLNADGSPEIYVYVTSAGSGSHGSMVAYAANQRKSLSEIYLPPLGENDGALKGYMGHDEFSVLEGAVGHRFPVYRESDTNVEPTGGMRQFQYKLVPGEAGWSLKIDRMIEF